MNASFRGFKILPCLIGQDISPVPHVTNRNKKKTVVNYVDKQFISRQMFMTSDGTRVSNFIDCQA